jgi:hypothetical protein
MAEAAAEGAEEKAKAFIASLNASLKVRRYAEAYLEHLLHDAPEPAEFKAGQGQPAFRTIRMRIDRILSGQDR